MADSHDSFQTDEFKQRMVDRAIDAVIGSIDALPPEVAARLREVYGAFLPAYIEIIRVKEGRPKQWQPRTIVPAPEVVEDMLHFFSDYQDVARSFKRINRQVKYLLTIDRQAEPGRFDRCVAEIVSGEKKTSVMNSIVDP